MTRWAAWSDRRRISQHSCAPPPRARMGEGPHALPTLREGKSVGPSGPPGRRCRVRNDAGRESCWAKRAVSQTLQGQKRRRPGKLLGQAGRQPDIAGVAMPLASNRAAFLAGQASGRKSCCRVEVFPLAAAPGREQVCAVGIFASVSLLADARKGGAPGPPRIIWRSVFPRAESAHAARSKALRRDSPARTHRRAGPETFRSARSIRVVAPHC